MYWKVITLQMMLRGGVLVKSGHGTVCVFVCMRPPRRGECSGAPHWPVGRDSLTGQAAFAFAGTMQNEVAIGVFAGAADSTCGECGCYKGTYGLDYWSLESYETAKENSSISLKIFDDQISNVLLTRLSWKNLKDVIEKLKKGSELLLFRLYQYTYIFMQNTRIFTQPILSVDYLCHLINLCYLLYAY